MATAKHKFQKFVFITANEKLVDFLDILQKPAKDAFGIAAHAILEQLIYAKMPLHLKQSKNQAHLENGTYEQIVTHLEKEKELNGLEALDELQINNVNQQITNTNAHRPKPTCQHCKKRGHYRNQCRLLKTCENKMKIFKTIPETKAVTLIPLSRAATSTTILITSKTVTEPKESQKLLTHPVRHVEKQTTPQRFATLQPMHPIDRLSGIEDRKDKIKYQREPTKVTLLKLLKLQPKI